MTTVEMTRPRDHVAQLTLNRPESLNSLNVDLVSSLHARIDEIAADPSVRAVVLTGAGRGFCSGLDMRNGYGLPAGVEDFGKTQQGYAIQLQISSLLTKMRALSQPVVAAINGVASGGGLGIALGADIRYAATSATFHAPFVRIGLSACDIGVSWLLPRIVGSARAHEMMLTARKIDAEEACRIGLVADVLPDEDLLDAALAAADQIVASAPFGIALTKQAMWAALEAPTLQLALELENRQQILATTTADFREARHAFRDRRPPTFTNR